MTVQTASRSSSVPQSVPQSVPLCDLRGQHVALRAEISAAIETVLESQQFILGPQVAQLEDQVAQVCGCTHAVGCSSGSDAILLALMALGIGPGDEVITSTFTFFATAGAVSRLGARPVFVDIDDATFNLLPSAVNAAVTSRTKAIMPVHLFGQAADMAAIGQIATRHNLAVVEDAAQAIGAEFGGRRVGSMGIVGCLSFFPSKNLGCMGDGGMVVTNDQALAKKMKILRNHGAEPKYYHSMIGGNFRLDTIQAAILLVKLRYLEQWNESRRDRARRYTDLIQASAASAAYVLPAEAAMRRHVFNQYVIRTQDRARLQQVFKARGIESAVYYPVPLHLQQCFSDLGYHESDCPAAELACGQVCALPMFPGLTDFQQELVVEGLVEAAC